jgi:flagellar biosynthesis GTPase FlhF
MVSRNRTRPLADSQPVVISAPTLKGAYKLVKQQFGDEAVILGSRSVTRRQPLGLGHEKLVEVMVQNPGGFSGRNGSAVTAESTMPTQEATKLEMVTEVERIENLVASIAEQYDKLDLGASITRNNPLAQSFLEGGATAETVQKVLTRFTSETGKPSNDRVGALTWLGENLKASNCDWEGFYGCHAFMGPIGIGQTGFILKAAAHLQKLGRRTLVLNVLPEDNGQIKQLQVEASRLGFDAAVIQKPGQLLRSEEHLSRYDVVLVDMPHLGHAQMASGGSLHGWLSGNTTFHRHMLIPSTQDPRDMKTVVSSARGWNCDWLGLTRMEQTDCPAKLLDFTDRVPLPISLIQHQGTVDIATSGRLLDYILGQPNSHTGNPKG